MQAPTLSLQVVRSGSPAETLALAAPERVGDPEVGYERFCPRCGMRTEWTGYAFEHTSWPGESGTLPCPFDPEPASRPDPATLPLDTAERLVADPATATAELLALAAHPCWTVWLVARDRLGMLTDAQAQALGLDATRTAGQ